TVLRIERLEVRLRMHLEAMEVRRARDFEQVAHERMAEPATADARDERDALELRPVAQGADARRGHGLAGLEPDDMNRTRVETVELLHERTVLFVHEDDAADAVSGQEIQFARGDAEHRSLASAGDRTRLGGSCIEPLPTGEIPRLGGIPART